ncbi:MAG: type II toxin-antitoxin system VapC family toxin, partial [Chloroflexi bacterium]|nr:type II toxin-antitoxin system VapC family toxin [Chloroflexota bacterium]
TALTLLWDEQGIQPIAPFLLPFEVANALHRRVARGEIEVEAAAGLMQDLMAVRVALTETPDLHRRALELASQLRQGAAYDAHYLSLAESLDCELWTADQRFYRAASPNIGNVRWIGEPDALV